MGPHPKNVIMLTCDAFGVMPAVARLSTEQAVYHFLCGYTAKVAATEHGLGKEPQATFSTCFGAPFMALHPSVYAKLLHSKIMDHGSKCWLVNTGWQGGPYGVGHRISIGHTRAIVNACVNGSLDAVPCGRHPRFGLEVPRECPGVPPEVLRPEQSWSDQAAYEEMTARLAGRFREAFGPFADTVPGSIREAGF
jgi:phosphoenolpyruvate carboxykinase (ATP)